MGNSRGIKVVKFGGSSLADAGQFMKVAQIIKSDSERRYVVPSAPGKRFDGDNKVTDLFYECYRLASEDQSIDEIFAVITERYNSIIKELGLELDLSSEFSDIRGAIKHHAGRDYAASRGEYLNGIILAKLIDFDFIDAAKVIKFSDNGSFDSEGTNAVLKDKLSRHPRAVIPGFYGSMPNGTIKTFSRGGSDITGSIAARAAEADIYENWTDVSGFMMADPRIVKNPKAIDIITYRELRELAYMGAGVLHEDAIFPVRFAGIPINIKNTNDPQSKGTMIVPQTDHFDAQNVITGIAGKVGFSVLTIEKDMMNSELGFGRRVLEAIENEGLAFEHLPSGIDTMSVIFSSAMSGDCRQRIINNVCRSVEPETIFIEDGLALIALVGRGMIKVPGTAARALTAVAAAGINIRMIDQGSSELNIIIGVDEKDYKTAVEVIYREFVKE